MALEALPVELLEAMTMPVPSHADEKVILSTHPLNTEPKPPSPSTLSTQKFLVAFLSSLKVKLYTLADRRISPSLLDVGSTVMDGDPFPLPPSRHPDQSTNQMF
ncbi:putative ovule protein [Hordeum vulgare]|nr:putative ovule protein [Hordeum vulgare]